MKTIIVVPCYNEAKRLNKSLFEHYSNEHTDTHFLFVNDGSKDDTLSVLKSLTEANAKLHLLDVQPNGGKAEAVRLGMNYALEMFKPDYIAFWDADLATPLNEIDHFIEWMNQGYDVVMGLRLMRLGALVRRKKLRHYLGRVFATCASMMLSLPVYDTQCGAKMFKGEVVRAICKDKFISRWLFDVELLARYKQQFGSERATKQIYELPLFQWEDVAGSQLKSRDFIKAPLELLKIKRAYR